MAESTTGCILSIQTSSAPQGEGLSVIPEDLGRQAAEMLLEEVYRVSSSDVYCQLSGAFRFCNFLGRFWPCFLHHAVIIIYKSLQK